MFLQPFYRLVGVVGTFVLPMAAMGKWSGSDGAVLTSNHLFPAKTGSYITGTNFFFFLILNLQLPQASAFLDFRLRLFLESLAGHIAPAYSTWPGSSDLDRRTPPLWGRGCSTEHIVN